jgi:hypothetical protein
VAKPATAAHSIDSLCVSLRLCVKSGDFTNSFSALLSPRYFLDDGHRIEFTASQAGAVHCPTLGRWLIVGWEQTPERPD